MAFTINGTTGINLATQPLTGQLPDGNAPSGSVVQVVFSNDNVNTASTSSSSFVATSFTGTITPSSSSNKVYVSMSGGNCYNLTAGGEIMVAIYRSINGGSYTNITDPFAFLCGVYSASARNSLCGNVLDSPATTLPITYKIYLKTNGTGTSNISSPNVNITMMEITG